MAGGAGWGARARSPAWLSTVLLVHLLALWLMAQALAPSARWRSPMPAAGMVWLQWLAPLAPDTPRPTHPVAARAAIVAKPAAQQDRGQSRPRLDTADSGPAPALPIRPMPNDAPAISWPDAAASAAPRPPLDLSLRSARQRADAASRPPAAWAREDSRVNRPSSAEDRLARDLGADPRLVEEDRGDVRRFRQGSSCVEVRSARDSQLNPWNQSTHQTPKQAKAC